MKNNLRFLFVLLISSQLFYACNTAKQYEFSNTSGSYHTEKALAKISSEPASESVLSEPVPEALSAGNSQEIAPLAAKPLVELHPAEIKVVPDAKNAVQAENVKMSRSERKALVKKLKKMKNAPADQSISTGKPMVDALELILAIFLPPIGVLLHDDGLSTRFWISLILTLLFFFPGMIYSILVVTDVI